jgi:hypothetical protein
LVYCPFLLEIQAGLWDQHAVCELVCHPFQLLKQMTDFHENLYEHCATEGQHKLTLFNFLQLATI